MALHVVPAAPLGRREQSALFQLLDYAARNGITALVALYLLWHVVSNDAEAHTAMSAQHLQLQAQQAEIVRNQVDLAKTLERLNARLDVGTGGAR